MLPFETFTGGVFETNSFFLEAPEGNILIDAPQGAAEHFEHRDIALLLLTHGHFDHIVDASKIIARTGCRCAIHPDSLPLVTSRDAFQRYGFALEIDPIQPDWLVSEGPAQNFLGLILDVFEVPGHCPGSLCFYDPRHGILFGGDVLFRGGVGRWDLPGGDSDQLFSGIREKLFSLPDQTEVYPGHGPSTTIGEEKAANPYVRP